MINYCIIIATCTIGSIYIISEQWEITSEGGSRDLQTDRLVFAQQRFYSDQTDPIVGCDYLDAAFELGSHHRMLANKNVSPDLLELAVSKHLDVFLNYYKKTSIIRSNSLYSMLRSPGNGWRPLNHRDIPGEHPIGGNGAEIIRAMMEVLVNRLKDESTLPKAISFTRDRPQPEQCPLLRR
jgi:hypothetical protein